MNSDSLKKLQDLRTKCPDKIVLGVIKGRHTFHTNLSGLDLSNCISVFFANSALTKIITQQVISHFDVVSWFDGGEFWSDNNLAHLDLLEFPNLKSQIEQLCQLVGSKNVRLVAMEEQFVRYVSEIRSQYNIPGPKPKDVELFSDKAKIKIAANEKNIPTAKYTIVHKQDLTEDMVVRLEELVPYPMFVKPINGVGGIGTEKVVIKNLHV